MWLPNPFYERIAQFWLFLGLMFIGSGVYLGPDFSLSLLYFAVGIGCVIWSLCVFVMRSRHRINPVRPPIRDDMEEEDDAGQPSEHPG
jgi:hypothetical protein